MYCISISALLCLLMLHMPGSGGAAIEPNEYFPAYQVPPTFEYKRETVAEKAHNVLSNGRPESGILWGEAEWRVGKQGRWSFVTFETLEMPNGSPGYGGWCVGSGEEIANVTACFCLTTKMPGRRWDNVCTVTFMPVAPEQLVYDRPVPKAFTVAFWATFWAIDLVTEHLLMPYTPGEYEPARDCVGERDVCEKFEVRWVKK